MARDQLSLLFSSSLLLLRHWQPLSSYPPIPPLLRITFFGLLFRPRIDVIVIFSPPINLLRRRASSPETQKIVTQLLPFGFMIQTFSPLICSSSQAFFQSNIRGFPFSLQDPGTRRNIIQICIALHSLITRHVYTMSFVCWIFVQLECHEGNSYIIVS